MSMLPHSCSKPRRNRISAYGGMALPGQSPGPNWERLDELGAKLSLVLSCPVRWPGYDKNMFVCRHGYAAAIFRLQTGDDWSIFIEEHDRFVKEG